MKPEFYGNKDCFNTYYTISVQPYRKRSRLRRRPEQEHAVTIERTIYDNVYGTPAGELSFMKDGDRFYVIKSDLEHKTVSSEKVKEMVKRFVNPRSELYVLDEKVGYNEFVQNFFELLNKKMSHSNFGNVLAPANRHPGNNIIAMNDPFSAVYTYDSPHTWGQIHDQASNLSGFPWYKGQKPTLAIAPPQQGSRTGGFGKKKRKVVKRKKTVNKWVQKVIKNPGSLTAYAKKVAPRKAFTKRGTLRVDWLREVAKKDKSEMRRRQAQLALRLKKMPKRGKKKTVKRKTVKKRKTVRKVKRKTVKRKRNGSKKRKTVKSKTFKRKYKTIDGKKFTLVGDLGNKKSTKRYHVYRETGGSKRVKYEVKNGKEVRRLKRGERVWNRKRSRKSKFGGKFNYTIQQYGNNVGTPNLNQMHKISGKAAYDYPIAGPSAGGMNMAWFDSKTNQAGMGTW